MTCANAPRDPGLQPERTILAWRRTGLTAVGVAFAVLKLHGEHGEFPAASIAALVGVVATTMAGLRLRRNRYARDPGHPSPMPTAVVACLCLGISLAALFSGVSIVFDRPR
ncbi:DUF202 domain-containing protein [Nocardia veterana]|uniref:DUF202 domain-containing protein n=1 Tax=Nocardia veterana TaxID=132249 RepID=UPI00157725D9